MTTAEASYAIGSYVRAMSDQALAAECALYGIDTYDDRQGIEDKLIQALLTTEPQTVPSKLTDNDYYI